MKVAIVVLETLTIPCVYDAPEPSQGTYGGEWGSPQVTTHLEVPEGLDPQCLMAVKDAEGNITLVSDPAKVQAKLDAQWVSVRAQQSDLLYKSDWTGTSGPVAALAAPVQSSTRPPRSWHRGTSGSRTVRL